MQTFQSKFTTDISQHQRTMRAFREQTCAAVQQARTELISLGAVSFGGLGLKDAIVQTIRLGKEMEMTRIAFNTMLGSAEKGAQTIAVLQKFADLTPFNNDEVIKSGRMLLNAGVATDQLTKKLTMIGDVSSGVNQPLVDMVMIYTKAANQGKIQAEELQQLGERGVPILQQFSKMLGLSASEIMELGSKGKLTFDLLDEAFKQMTSEGGQYFNLMEKQSRSLGGKWSNLEAEFAKFATSIGEESIPGLTKALDEFLAKINEMKESGELDALASDAAQMITYAADILKNFVQFLVDNREILSSFGMDAARAYFIVKIFKLVTAVGRGIVGYVQTAAAAVDSATLASQRAVEAAEAKKRAEILATEKLREALAARQKMRDANGALSMGKDAGANPEKIKQLSQAAESTTIRYRELRKNALEAYNAIPDTPPKGLTAMRQEIANVGKSAVKFGKGMGSALVHPLAAAKMAVQNFATAAGVAFAGYELGIYLGKLLKLEDVFTRLILKSQGMSDARIDGAMKEDKPEPVVKNNDLVKGAKRYKEIQNELKKLNEQFLILDKAGKTSERDVVQNKIIELDAEATRLDEAARNYAQASEAAVKRIPEEQKKLKEAIRNQQQVSKIPQPVPAGQHDYTYSERLGEWEKQQNEAELAVQNQRKVLMDLIATRTQYQKTLSAYRMWEKQEAEKKAAETAEQVKKESAAQKLRTELEKEKKEKELADKKKFAEKEAEVNRLIAKNRAEVQESNRKLGVEKQRDAMEEKIAGWRKEIEGYQKDIAKTEAMLQKLGFSVEDDILKTPDQIAQERKDSRLKQKIELANKGSKVEFTAEERDRINQLQAAQKEARENLRKISGNEKSIASEEQKINALDRREARIEQENRLKMNQQKLSAANAMAQQLETLQKANMPLDQKLKGIEEVLKKRLPDETM